MEWGKGLEIKRYRSRLSVIYVNLSVPDSTSLQQDQLVAIPCALGVGAKHL